MQKLFLNAPKPHSGRPNNIPMKAGKDRNKKADREIGFFLRGCKKLAFLQPLLIPLQIFRNDLYSKGKPFGWDYS